MAAASSLSRCIFLVLHYLLMGFFCFYKFNGFAIYANSNLVYLKTYFLRFY